ncbi:MFS transporter [Micromonospora sp. CPCC 206061]|uniref:MFS transporter n=1 Tax=Micromonospora sp. CPCC 206061 TaxID=3122410 RepID=UPI002FF18AC0
MEYARTLAAATLANTVGLGLWLAGSAMFLTRGVGLSPAEVGLGLTIAGFAGLCATVPLGHLADRRDPRTLRIVVQVLQAAVAASYLLVRSFPAFLVVAIVDALLVAGSLTLRAALIAAVAGPADRVRVFAMLRAVANVGISVGAALAALALVADTRTGYALLVAGNATTYLISAALLLRLPAQVPAPEAPRARRWEALRDRPFLAVTAASAVMSLHEVVLRLVLPLWIATQTQAPRVAISAVLVVNTALTILLAVRASRAVGSAVHAGQAMRRAGFLLAAAMLLYAATGGMSTGTAVVVLLLTTALYTIGDLLHATAAAGLSYELAAPHAIGQYQGVSQLMTGLARAAGPALLTVAVLDGGLLGWAALASVFALAGITVPLLTPQSAPRPDAVRHLP